MAAFVRLGQYQQIQTVFYDLMIEIGLSTNLFKKGILDLIS